MANWRIRSSSPKETENLSDSNRCGSTYRHRGNFPSHENLQITGRRTYGFPQKTKTFFPSWEFFVQLSRKNSDQIILELIEKLHDFGQFLESNLELNWIVLITAILSKISSSCFRHNKIAILKVAARASLWPKLEEHLRTLKDKGLANQDRNKHFGKNPEEFFGNLLVVCESFTEIISSVDCEILSKLVEAIEVIVPYFEEERNVKVSQKTNLVKKLSLCFEQSWQDKSGDSPLNNFRTLNIYPTSEEILTLNCEPASNYFVEGKYDNVEHYLDVQFRLLKENFFAPLRQDIAEYIEYAKSSDPNSKATESGIYSDVAFQSFVVTEHGIGVIIDFSNQQSKEDIFSPDSLCFLYGTMVFCTKDNFSSVCLGCVGGKNSEQQQLIIYLELEFNNYDFNACYTMVDSYAYFTPYYYSLKNFQGMHEVDFPMKKYLVDAVPSVELPGYLDASSSVYTLQDRRVDLFGNNWPSADELKLDQFQYSAFRAALTQKLNIIQGAPGTGKTYLGIEIVKTLLHEDNRKHWYNGAPILIVSFSNQALDQFLEGLISVTSRIIRVGENLTDEKLEKYTLKVARMRNFKYKKCAKTWRSKLTEVSQQVEKCIRCLMEVKNVSVIINFTHFVIIDANIKSSWFFGASDADLLAWLFDDGERQNINPHTIEILEIISYIREKEKKFDTEPKISKSSKHIVLISQSHIWIKMSKISNTLQNINSDSSGTGNIKELKAQLIDLWKTYQYFERKMRDRVFSANPIKPANVNYHSPHSMDEKDRWNLYFYWLNLYKNFEEAKLTELQCEHRELSQNFLEIGRIFDFQLMERALVVGMTQFTAPRLQAILQSLKCPIVVIEDVSQVLESHVLGSLTKHCEHLILMSHHQNLHSVISDKFRNCGISMMERMISNKMPYHILGVQHRTTTKISQLLLPRIYPVLETHQLVTELPAASGLPSCIFFVHHENEDIEQHNTKTNLYQAKFLINLARYLIHIGYESEDILILTDYSDNLHILCEETEKYEGMVKDVNICDLDNYKGVKYKIILLSLMGNKHEGEIESLKYENSVVFALSQAEEALYMMGNIDLLCENSETWRRIKVVLKEQNCLGNYFPVWSQIQPDHIDRVNKPEDFDQFLNKSKENSLEEGTIATRAD